MNGFWITNEVCRHPANPVSNSENLKACRVCRWFDLVRVD